MEFVVFGLIAYLLGSIPTAVWIGKAWYGLDVREHGSKNAGATNTFRILGKKPGIMVLLIDVFKGAVAAALPVVYSSFNPGTSEELTIQFQLIASICAVTGHVFPLFAQFKGGKGVATSLGVIIGLHPMAALISFGVFLIVFILSNFVSLGAITAAICFPIIIRFDLKE